MSLFPFIDNSGPVPEPSTVQSVPREYAWDFTTNDFILKDGKFTVVEGLEAIKIWIYKALNTQRFRYLAYTWDYGQEIEELIGNRDISREAIESELKRRIEEALLINAHIKSIQDVTATILDNVLSFNFMVVTNYGEVQISV